MPKLTDLFGSGAGNAAATPPSSTQPALPQIGFLRERQVLAIFPFSRATLWNRVKAGTFPAPVNIAQRCTAWAAEDIRAEYDRLRQVHRTPA